MQTLKKLKRPHNVRGKHVAGIALVAVLAFTATYNFSLFQNRHMPTGVVKQSTFQAATQSKILTIEYPTGQQGQEYFLEYTIQPGDSLGAIAQAHNTTVNAILAANKTLTINANNITAGRKILIPIPVDYD